MENNILIALEFYIPDNWYGTRKRFTSANKFRTKSEAKVALSALRKIAASKMDHKLKPMTKIGKSEDHKFLTYLYHSMGPGYYCSDISISNEELLKNAHKYSPAKLKQLEELLNKSPNPLTIK